MNDLERAQKRFVTVLALSIAVFIIFIFSFFIYTAFTQNDWVQMSKSDKIVIVPVCEDDVVCYHLYNNNAVSCIRDIELASRYCEK